MPPATPEQSDLFDQTVQVAAYRPTLTNNENRLKLIETDEVPPADEQGRRRAEGWKAVWEGFVDPALGNFSGNLHGAATAWIVDTCTSAVMVALHTDTFWGLPMLAGVSINLNTDYFHPGLAVRADRRGSKIRVEAEVLKLTTTLSNMKCDIREAETGKLLSSSTHLKAWRPGRDSKL